MEEKGKQNICLFSLRFQYKLIFSLFMMTPGAKYFDNVAIYGFITQLVICYMV